MHGYANAYGDHHPKSATPVQGNDIVLIRRFRAFDQYLWGLGLEYQMDGSAIHQDKTCRYAAKDGRALPATLECREETSACHCENLKARWRFP